MGELNLLPLEIKDVHRKLRNKLLVVMIVLAVVGGMIVAMLIPKIIAAGLQIKESRLKRDVTLKHYITDENARLNGKIKDYKGYFNQIDAINASNEKSSFKLNELSKDLPPSVTITTLVINKDGISLAATSRDYTGICNFVANLEISKKYKNVQLVGISSDNGSTPKYTCTVKIIK